MSDATTTALVPRSQGNTDIVIILDPDQVRQFDDSMFAASLKKYAAPKKLTYPLTLLNGSKVKLIGRPMPGSGAHGLLKLIREQQGMLKVKHKPVKNDFGVPDVDGNIGMSRPSSSVSPEELYDMCLAQCERAGINVLPVLDATESEQLTDNTAEAKAKAEQEALAAAALQAEQEAKAIADAKAAQEALEAANAATSPPVDQETSKGQKRNGKRS